MLFIFGGRYAPNGEPINVQVQRLPYCESLVIGDEKGWTPITPQTSSLKLLGGRSLISEQICEQHHSLITSGDRGGSEGSSRSRSDVLLTPLAFDDLFYSDSYYHRSSPIFASVYASSTTPPLRSPGGSGGSGGTGATKLDPLTGLELLVCPTSHDKQYWSQLNRARSADLLPARLGPTLVVYDIRVDRWMYLRANSLTVSPEMSTTALGPFHMSLGDYSSTMPIVDHASGRLLVLNVYQTTQDEYMGWIMSCQLEQIIAGVRAVPPPPDVSVLTKTLAALKQSSGGSGGSGGDTKSAAPPQSSKTGGGPGDDVGFESSESNAYNSVAGQIQWKVVSPPIIMYQPPLPHCAAFDPVRRRLWLFGRHTYQIPNKHGIGGCEYTDWALRYFDVDSQTWSPAPAEVPHSLCHYDSHPYAMCVGAKHLYIAARPPDFRRSPHHIMLLVYSVVANRYHAIKTVTFTQLSHKCLPWLTAASHTAGFGPAFWIWSGERESKSLWLWRVRDHTIQRMPPYLHKRNEMAIAVS